MVIETILLAIGPSDAKRADRLVEETIDVAGPTGATVVLGHVFTPDEYEETLDKLGINTTVREVSPDDVASRQTTVRQIAEQFEETGINYEIRGAVGDHGKAIVDLANSVDADRIIVGGRRRSPAGKAVFGSVAQEVMLSAPCPVTFVRSDTK
ncbi:universal stress protein [halophilic archaeon]|nr:universal stress protein [halophilic archaeon]